MRTLAAAVCCLLVFSLCCVRPAAAQGKSNAGLSKALAKAGGKGASSGGLGRATQSLSRSGSGLGRAAAMNHAAGPKAGALGQPLGSRPDVGPRATAVSADSASRQQHLLAIEQRNRDHRLAQAAHLRQIGERNGDADLLANAERMEAFANDHYLQRAEHLERFGTIGADPLAQGVGSAEGIAQGAASSAASPIVELPGEPASERAHPTGWLKNWWSAGR